MRSRIFIIGFLLILGTVPGWSQQDSLAISTQSVLSEPQSERDFQEYDPLAPARAAFYSAVLPGLGQAYNERYWKIPIVYAALGVGAYFYINNTNEYHRYRDAYRIRLAGGTNDEFSDENGAPLISNSGLEDAQEFYQRNQEISLLVIIGLYALNIIDANVDAHLRQFNVSEDLSLKPSFNYDQLTGKTDFGMTLNFKL